jgi:hypothetical protein
MKKTLILFSLCLIAALNYQCKKDNGGDDPNVEPPVAAGNFDKITGKIGYERVEIDLIKAGRVPASQLNFGTATKTVVEYDGNTNIIDSLCSWVNITGLTQSKAYTFKIYAMDASGSNKLEAKEISLTPYTSTELANVVIAEPDAIVFASGALLSWPYGVSTGLADYYGLSYSYTDKNGNPRTGTATGDYPQFIVTDLGGETTVDIKYKIIPKRDYIPIIDTVFLDEHVPLESPSGSTPFEPAEAAILTANGITTFTPDGVADIETLYYPPHTRSLEDIVYFSNLKTLDLTGGDVPSLTELVYPCAWGAEVMTDTVGRGPWLPFMKRMDNVNGVVDNAVSGVVILQTLLENNFLEKVRYIPNSMGLDEALAPFVESGKVELVELPNEVPITNNFCFGNLVYYLSFAKWMTVTPDPADAPAGSGATNILKGTSHGITGAVAISTPFEYKFNIQEYRYLKFKVYVPTLSAEYKDLKNINVSFLNMLSTNYPNMIYPGNNREEFFAPQVAVSEGAWTDVTIDASVATNAYTYVALIHFGSGAIQGDPNGLLPSGDQDGIYVAGLRFSKTP